jgi:hypothetical protein
MEQKHIGNARKFLEDRVACVAILAKANAPVKYSQELRQLTKHRVKTIYSLVISLYSAYIARHKALSDDRRG